MKRKHEKNPYLVIRPWAEVAALYRKRTGKKMTTRECRDLGVRVIRKMAKRMAADPEVMEAIQQRKAS